ncbi:MAG TPA: DUF2127 domain-containing protein [Acidimicrobiales bacterium]
MARAHRPSNRYELLTCSWRDHVVVGADADQITSDDHLLAREMDGIRWLRCLRCDGWFQYPIPSSPTGGPMPSRDEIELPVRGPLLRDHYVLRLIAIDRAIHVIVLTALAVILFTFARHHTAFQHDYNEIMNDLSGGDPGTTSVRGVLGHLRNVFHYSSRHLVELGLGITAYAVLEAVEMVGLWKAKRWAEYLTFVAITALVPFEVYELTIGVSVFKVITLVINLAIVVYLLFAKRLFGVRGGHRTEMERRQRLSGWEAVERSTIEAPVRV